MWTKWFGKVIYVVYDIGNVEYAEFNIFQMESDKICEKKTEIITQGG